VAAYAAQNCARYAPSTTVRKKEGMNEEEEEEGEGIRENNQELD